MKVATSEGTKRFASKFSQYKDFYQVYDGVLHSKLGLGTFINEPYKEQNYEFSYKYCVTEAIKNGINVIDGASNYRYGQSEREIGEAIRELEAEGFTSREELIVTSKGGFIQLDFPFPENPYHWINDNIINAGLATKEDIVIDQHCMTPKYLEFSIERSLKNMQLESIDIYYLHNPEMELGDFTYEQILKKIEEAFEVFERYVKAGKIKYYGIATWNGLINSKGEFEYLSLQDLVDIAQKVGGDDNHFKFIQAPFNLAKTAMLTNKNQTLADGNDYTLIEAAYKLGLQIQATSALLQMNLFKRPFTPEVGYILDSDMKLTSDIQLALQFNRSTLGVLTSFFSTRIPEHVVENLKITEVKAVNKAKYDLLFKL